jgi:hypothetical protein
MKPLTSDIQTTIENKIWSEVYECHINLNSVEVQSHFSCMKISVQRVLHGTICHHYHLVLGDL